MGRKNSPIYNQELNDLIAQYEAAKADNRQLYLDSDQLSSIADQYASEKRFKETQEVIDYGLQLHPGSTDLLVEQAYLYLDTQRIHQAKEVTDSITEDYETTVKMLKAELLLNEGQLEAAQNLVKTIEESDDLENIIDVIYLFLDLGYPEAAKEWLDNANAQYKDDEDYIAVTADYLAATNQLEAASEHYDRLIDIDPFNPAYWMGLAKNRFIEEDYEKAIEACDFALAADDKYGEAYAYRAHCYFSLNNSEASIENYRKAMEFKSIPPELCYMFIGMSHSSNEEWKEADECYRNVIRIFEEKGDSNSPLLVDTYTSAAIATFNLGNREEAHELCDKALAISPNDSNVYLAEGKLFLKEEADKQAFECFKIALSDNPTAEMWYMIGSTYSEEDMLYQTKLCFEEAYKLDPNYADVTEKLSILCLMHNEIDDFFKYNSECEQPIDENTILDLISQYEKSDEGKNILLEVWERMKKEKENNNSN